MSHPNHYPDVWAKSPPPQGATGESLESHTLQVWHNLWRLRDRAPDLPSTCGMPRLWLRIAVAVMFHDLGKCCKGFQAAVHSGARFPHRHEVLSLAVLSRMVVSDPEGDLRWIAAAILTHHKDLAEIDALYPDDADFDGLAELDAEADSAFYATAANLFFAGLQPLLAPISDLKFAYPTHDSALDATATIRPMLRHVFGLTREIRVAGSLGGSSIAALFLRGLILLADHAGSAGEKFAVLDQIRSEAAMLSALELGRENLYPHQSDVPPGNSTLIAPTGSGKTQASLLWASKTGSLGPGNPVLFYVLPFQASINAMRERLAESLGSAKVTLQHSRAAQAIYRQLLDRDYQPAVAALVARRERSLARLHAKPVRILTPYQLLRAAYQLKGHEALWTDASNSLMIFDEIHAYEPVRLGMILATLGYLTRHLGVRALVMSATMPRRLLLIIAAILPDNSHLSASPDIFVQFRRHRVHLLSNDLLEPTIVERVLADAATGKAVLVVATTVGRAQQIFRLLRSVLKERVSLLHGRFHSEDRFEKEKDLASKRGPNGNEPVVLVATQVVEVSLDVDFDVLYTDPAPLEALVQRFGRVNRRRRTRLRDVFVMTAIPEGSPVYADQVVRAALDQLATVDGLPLDESLVQGMLDIIYDGTWGDEWAAGVELHTQDFRRNVLESMMPFCSNDELAAKFDELFDGFQVLPKCLESEYIRRKEEDELSAPALLVPITRGQFFAIKPARRHGVFIADRPYTKLEGLKVDSPPGLDGL